MLTPSQAIPAWENDNQELNFKHCRKQRIEELQASLKFLSRKLWAIGYWHSAFISYWNDYELTTKELECQLAYQGVE